MKVDWTQQLSDNRKIQIGEASWAGDREDEELAGGNRSVRMYYTNARGGMRRNSPEISIPHLIDMVIWAAKRGEIADA
jgi:hypothetical protein